MRFFCVPRECYNNKTTNNKALRIHCHRGQTPQLFLLPIDPKKTLCSPISLLKVCGIIDVGILGR